LSPLISLNPVPVTFVCRRDSSRRRLRSLRGFNSASVTVVPLRSTVTTGVPVCLGSRSIRAPSFSRAAIALASSACAGADSAASIATAQADLCVFMGSPGEASANTVPGLFTRPRRRRTDHDGGSVSSLPVEPLARLRQLAHLLRRPEARAERLVL